jgi:hypothetical protein
MSNLNTFGPEKLVMEREMQSGLYNLPAFFFSRWGVEVPFRVIFPLCYSAILYFMIGFQEEGENFILFAIGLILIDNCGTNSQTNTPPPIRWRTLTDAEKLPNFRIAEANMIFICSPCVPGSVSIMICSMFPDVQQVCALPSFLHCSLVGHC